MFDYISFTMESHDNLGRYFVSRIDGYIGQKAITAPWYKKSASVLTKHKDGYRGSEPQ